MLNQPLFQQDNARSRTARVTSVHLQENNFDLLPQPAWSPDSSVIYFYLFIRLLLNNVLI
jgi:hypothetical protein